MKNINFLIGLIVRNNFKSVLDIGIGYAVLAYNLRNMLEQYKFDKTKWTYTINGIDICDKYITPMHKYLYNKIVIGDALKMNIPTHDVIVASDFLEHLPKEKGIDFIKKLKSKCNLLIFMTPYGFFLQGPKNDNENEIHVSSWSPEDFINIGGFQIIIEGTYIYAVHRRMNGKSNE